jgi:hypothetical protein
MRIVLSLIEGGCCGLIMWACGVHLYSPLFWGIMIGYGVVFTLLLMIALKD